MSYPEEVKRLQIPLQELSDATNGFSDRNLVAKGGFGKVYRGVSVKHGDLAVKMLDPRLGQGDHEFRTEIAVLSVYKHENIVSLLGFCDEERQKILVYKYENNGSLEKHLNNKDLTWIQRLQICLDAAHGLQYLHDDVGEQHRILHRDVKSSNILLGDNWIAKITDFGLSRVGPANTPDTFLITRPCGTLGYIDPEYSTTSYLTEKTDVYSFGVVLFEVLCGRPAYAIKYNDNRDFLTNLIKTHWRRNTLGEIIFPDLQKQIKAASLLTFTTIAYQCLLSGNERPTMKKVVERLRIALINQLTPSDPNDSDLAAYLGGQPALLASTSQSIHASSSQLWKYDVFISFRGEDTRRTLIDHLYTALVQQGIITYMDDEELLLGKSLDSSLIEAIQESRMAIILFSPNYASSSWCLNELEFIMKNKDERGQIVIPIFYDVEPSEVIKQTMRYGEALARHELNYDISKVASWREALARAGDLTGWESRAIGHEAILIRSICNDILSKLLSLRSPSEASAETSANANLIGIETRVQELKSRLEEVGPGGVHIIGICGMWGSGKSTLASSIYIETNRKFEGSCFVKDVRARSRIHGLKMLLEEILSNVLKLKMTFANLEQALDMMKKGLRQNSVLIVLDDVHHIDQLKMFAGSKDWFGKGSRVIFMTRNKDLMKARDVPIHNVRMLDDTEATELFSRHAFGESEPPRGFWEVSRNIVSKLEGHPSALRSLGSFLHGKDKRMWIIILNRLKGIPVPDILKSFKIRDDGVERNIFKRFLTEGLS